MTISKIITNQGKNITLKRKMVTDIIKLAIHKYKEVIL